MHSHRAALTRLAGYLDGLRTPIDGWQVAKQMQRIAREALGAPSYLARTVSGIAPGDPTTSVNGRLTRCGECGALYEAPFVTHSCPQPSRPSKPPFHDHYPR